MRWSPVLVLPLYAWLATASALGDQPVPPETKAILVIHGGAGTLPRSEMTPEREKEYREALTRALEAGHAVLRAGGESLDAVVSAVKVMEDSPLFNAGKGAVFNHEGKHELDASLMDGARHRAGAVANATIVKNPITAARAVMEKTTHVLLAGPGADAFAKEVGLETVENSYFDTEERRKKWRKALEEERTKAAGRPASRGGERSLGTVGAVALDRRGQLAAGTSTGGLNNKRFGRVGDSPIIGAGTYADETCAVSCTGDGEYFIRLATAHDVAALMRYKGLSPAEAGAVAIHAKMTQAGGEGGAIILDAQGRFAAPFNSGGMYRGWVAEDGKMHVAIYPD